MRSANSLRRRILTLLTLVPVISSCNASPKTVTLDIVFFNYLNRPIFDAFIDGDAGAASFPYPDTGGSTISGVELRLGPKNVIWTLDGPKGTPRNGEKVAAKNKLELLQLPPGTEFLAIHIYPDETVELIPTVHYPRATEKGVLMQKEYRLRPHPDAAPPV